jgi:hypothetical protein
MNFPVYQNYIECGVYCINLISTKFSGRKLKPNKWEYEGSLQLMLSFIAISLFQYVEYWKWGCQR